MKTYLVIIEATVIKTIEVEAKTEEEAIELAHQEFSVEDADGSYDEETLSVEEK